jgi:hypothetical protein
MTEQSNLALAKQGDIRAINHVVNYLLKDKGIKARVHIKDSCVVLTLESTTPLEQVSTIDAIHKILHNLAISQIITAKVQSKLENISKVNWVGTIDLVAPVKTGSPKNVIVPQTQTAISAQKESPEHQEKQSENQESTSSISPKKSSWSPWFPYPSSWLRALALNIWLGIVVWITMYWARLVGGIISIISRNPVPLFAALVLALVISVIIFAYIHHILFGKKTTGSNQWLPRGRSWWEGIYAPIVTFISFLIVAIIIIPFVPATICDFYQSRYWQYCVSSFRGYNYFRIYNYDYIEALAVISAIIWLLSSVYLYQIEFLIRRNFSPQKFIRFLLIAITSFLLISLVSFTMKNAKPLQSLLENSISIMAKNINSPKVVSPSPTATIAASPPVKPESQAQLPNSSATSSPTPVQNLSPTPSPVQVDPFGKATEHAMNASKLVQVAKTKAEWQEVAIGWESAINFMKAVPLDHPKYQIAQKKVQEYQGNLDYAKLAGDRASI